MRPFLYALFLSFLAQALVQCGHTVEDPNQLFSIKVVPKKTTYVLGDTLTYELITKTQRKATAVSWVFDGVSVDEQPQALADTKLGKHTVTAIITTPDGSVKVSDQVLIVAAAPPKLYTYKILERYTHDIKAYTQGLEFYQDTLYEGTGQYGSSSLRQLDLKRGKVLQQNTLDNQYFGEGITILNNKIYQLTWRSNTGLVYDLASFELIDQFQYDQSRQGWGLCNDGDYLYKSDGTEKIWRLDPVTYKELDYIEVYTDKLVIDQINELEWVNGKIYANIYQKDAVAIVDPKTGAVEGVINLKGLQKEVTQHAALDVLNGIAYDGSFEILYITGKNWDVLFKVQVIEKQ
ncbi:MAG: hypothetical protein ABR84_01685 [Cryomorphaceae bacterium BACL21 MAG-121220-bin10]|jgi:glutaminyl-peptide cyclotransferase|nr:MAG: hypothetical protein ABR84_01685 [Cryomorphaceae bacterium BACL21 MAG-121220-bin10]MDA0701212.1 glutaminyl-peptide cyclotransferase [Bacteroidota bacterium]MDB9781962.1 glutaminyl-peptide cyclotransferase [Winogradskyella sp.]|tara:strand:- start:8298 stop:9341 length:1044 start_codon:yes stop_codon:yes gene_type:complete